MNSKSKLSRLQCSSKNIGTKVDTVTNKESEIKSSDLEEKKIASLNTTPISKKNLGLEDNEDERVSPFFLRFTQETCDDDLDVVWDWDSPRSKPNRTLRKRILHSSPKIPKKHFPCEKNLPQFNSLKAELEQLAYNLNVDSLVNNACDSSDDSVAKKSSDDIFILPKIPAKDQVAPTNNLFDDDSFDEEMIKCSQKVEETYNLNKWCSSIMHNNNKETKPHFDETMKDDSFDIFLEAVDIEKLSQASSSSSPPKLININKSTQALASPRSISRTNSVPIEIFSKPSTVTNSSLVSRTKSEESGKKIQCSPEEIEKKRQEARAKLELKKKQHEIERKRLEALERLKKKQARKLLSQKR